MECINRRKRPNMNVPGSEPGNLSGAAWFRLCKDVDHRRSLKCRALNDAAEAAASKSMGLKVDAKLVIDLG